MSMMELGDKDYSDGRTKQSFKDGTDINKLLYKAAKGDSISHLAKHGAVYGDFSDIDDLLTAHNRLERGKQIFMDLPGEVRAEFNNNPGDFYRFVNDPNNVDRLAEVLPRLAEPGDQLREVQRRPDNVPADPPPPPAPAEVDGGPPPE